MVSFVLFIQPHKKNIIFHDFEFFLVECFFFLKKSVYTDFYDVSLYIKNSQTKFKNFIHTSN
jgi:hypothetical protein